MNLRVREVSAFDRLKKDPGSWLKFAAVLVAGGLVGFLYYRWFGCKQACPLNSNPYLMTGIGVLLGLNFGIGLIWGSSQKEDQSAQNEK